ncbi:MAG TPA: hypothetical protein VK856_02205 [Anaerolineaceae bacterium]|nr:hypothetical protein [Anaerolineaceae bacterium]
MSKLALTKEEISTYILEILSSPKYRSIDIPEDLVESIYDQEIPHHKKLTDLNKAVCKKLHNIVANYLGNIDYDHYEREFKQLKASDDDQLKELCFSILSQHHSTKERLPDLDNFYSQIYQKIGKPKSILDLACGYHPFGLPWMDLDQDWKYYAFDIIKARVRLINTFFSVLEREQLAFQQDILINPPQMEADVAYFFKEAHRFEQRQRGCNRNFWQALKVKYILVSLPKASMTKRHEKTDQHRKLVYENLNGLNWKVDEFQIGNELFFLITK